MSWLTTNARYFSGSANISAALSAALVWGGYLAGSGVARAAADGVAPVTTPRPARDDGELRYWLENMVVYHGFSDEEVSAATGLSPGGVADWVRKLKLDRGQPPELKAGERVRVMPYPGGRHPRIGFLEGAIDPQRDTKLSIFTPWERGGYVVIDVPEAIFSNLGLTYLAHTHIPTIWDVQGVKLKPVEWQRNADGTLTMERTLPNQVAFGTKATARPDGVVFEMWLSNGTSEKLTGLRVQNCVMLKMAPGFNGQTNQHTVFRPPYAAIKSLLKSRWIITAFDPCQRPWANPPVPCLHADPQFPDCEPGQTTRVRGWLSFYEGEDVRAEFERLDGRWRNRPER